MADRAESLELEVISLRRDLIILQQQVQALQDTVALAGEDAQSNTPNHALDQRMILHAGRQSRRTATVEPHLHPRNGDMNLEVQRLRHTVETQQAQLVRFEERFSFQSDRLAGYQHSISNDLDNHEDQLQEIGICGYTSIPKQGHYEW